MGSIILIAEKLTTNYNEVNIHFVGRNLTNERWFGRSISSYYSICRHVPATKSRVVVYRSEVCASLLSHKVYKFCEQRRFIINVFYWFWQVIRDSLNPDWKPTTIPIRSLCNGYEEENFFFMCYYSNAEGSGTLIGWIVQNVAQITNNLKKFSFLTKKVNLSICFDGEKLVTWSIQLKPLYWTLMWRALVHWD